MGEKGRCGRRLEGEHKSLMGNTCHDSGGRDMLDVGR